jgi:hypothetical protein
MWGYTHDLGRVAIAAALLIAGASKLASPRPLAASLGQVFGLRRAAGIGIARAVATIELAAAFLLAGAWAVMAGLALTGLVGAGVVLFVITAVRRGATMPCGCFGESSGRPIGIRNVLAGAGLLAGAIGLLAMPETGTAAAEVTLPLTAAIALVTVMIRDRARLLAPFRRHFQPMPAGSVPTGPEVS